MDLGIKGRRALVCASSKGLGRACAFALAAEGVHVTLTARGAEADVQVNIGETDIQTEARLRLRGGAKEWRFVAPV